MSEMHKSNFQQAISDFACLIFYTAVTANATNVTAEKFTLSKLMTLEKV